MTADKLSAERGYHSVKTNQTAGLNKSDSRKSYVRKKE